MTSLLRQNRKVDHDKFVSALQFDVLLDNVDLEPVDLTADGDSSAPLATEFLLQGTIVDQFHRYCPEPRGISRACYSPPQRLVYLLQPSIPSLKVRTCLISCLKLSNTSVAWMNDAIAFFIISGQVFITSNNLQTWTSFDSITSGATCLRCITG